MTVRISQVEELFVSETMPIRTPLHLLTHSHAYREIAYPKKGRCSVVYDKRCVVKPRAFVGEEHDVVRVTFFCKEDRAKRRVPSTVFACVLGHTKAEFGVERRSDRDVCDVSLNVI
jgi:hypothetical protein